MLENEYRLPFSETHLSLNVADVVGVAVFQNQCVSSADGAESVTFRHQPVSPLNSRGRNIRNRDG